MDFIQDFVTKQIEAKRKDRMLYSDQLTLGQIIERLTEISKRSEKDSDVVYDFEYLFPTEINSWRGSYSELALNFCNYGDEGDPRPMKLSEFLTLLNGTVGKTFTGYKGGDFTMDESTPVWVANYGNSGNTAVVDVVDQGYQVMIMTAYQQY